MKLWFFLQYVISKDLVIRRFAYMEQRCFWCSLDSRMNQIRSIDVGLCLDCDINVWNDYVLVWYEYKALIQYIYTVTNKTCSHEY